ncbi:MAG TPA: small ribosomal subunit Rsm22 family protein [Xanthobacteraceae bacterium]|jgi:ribosomal protein RSM22 (predicted rRNA methylase)|nr:small ribosomal subunit Rsm22 family protein [Xanthobacteraceae bacterium]
MELPLALHHAVDRMLDGVALSDIAAAAAELSQRYREERRDGKLHVATDRAVLAYLAARLPATYAAVRASFAAAADRRPDFAPTTFLDIGAGPGTALWAAKDCWPGVNDALLLERSPIFAAHGETLAAAFASTRITWRIANVAGVEFDAAPRDLVTATYLLSELASNDAAILIDAMWRATADMLVLVEPGTPAGWQRILAARTRLLAAGAHLIAPCPHAQPCPLPPPDWCHFARRVARSRIHRYVKSADVPWEDEKFIYLAVSRKTAARESGARIIAPPRRGSGRVTLKLCRPDGTVGERFLSRRDGVTYKDATRKDWGDLLAE